MDSLVDFIHITASPPSLEDNTADLDRLRRAIAGVTGEWPAVSFGRCDLLAGRFRSASFAGVAVVNRLDHGLELVDFLKEPAQVMAGLALDLGTTHLEASLLDLRDARCLAKANLENPQVCLGADILTRVHRAARLGGREELQDSIVRGINELAWVLAERAGIIPAEIRAMSVSGNTAMVHFLLGLATAPLIREPYIPTVNRVDPLHADDLGLVIHPAAPVWVMPGIGSYFGGDLISGIVACGLDREEQVSMLVDVGTNAEVVVGCKDWLIACAGAAGPALEGGVARMGMRAAPGAIEHIGISADSGEISYTTIGGGRPRGICGSGVIDLVAEMYLAGIIDLRGKFRLETGHSRLIENEEGPAFMVALPEESADGRPVIFGQVDLDAVMRSKAAMYSILTTLVSQVGIAFDELARINVAGAFGRHISPRQAIVIGMLPDLPHATFAAVGNSSLRGAELVLTDRRARESCLKIINKITYLELNVNQEFMMRFSGSRFIPHTDRTLFPSVPFFS